MSPYHLVTHPDPFLRTPTLPVSTIDQRIVDLVRAMIRIMYAEDGAGVAAIQIGALERIFVLDGILFGQMGPLIFINPEIDYLSEEKELREEGCLSFPGTFIKVPRSKEIQISAISMEGKKFSLRATGLAAQALQHEYDHLQGVLLIDHLEGASSR